MRSAIFIGTVLFSSICGASEWIPYVPQARIVQETIVQQPIIQYQQTVPQVYYQWIPYVVSQPVITERRCLIFKRTIVENVPVIQWVYQPMVLR